MVDVRSLLAIDPGDFVAYSETLEFGPEFGAVTTYSVTVQVRNDAAVENTEAFFVTVTPGPGELGALVLQNSSLVQIVDNDGKHIVWSLTNRSLH